jgi:hypothetical protein
VRESRCAELKKIEHVKKAKRRECEDCVRMGGEWVHLRTCQECGGTRCCDNSPNHRGRHYAEAQHPGSRSAAGEPPFAGPHDATVEQRPAVSWFPRGHAVAFVRGNLAAARLDGERGGPSIEERRDRGPGKDDESVPPLPLLLRPGRLDARLPGELWQRR